VTLVDNGDGTATLSGTPADGEGGDYSLTIIASNGVSPDDDQTFTLTVNEAAEITSADHVTFKEGEFGEFIITTSGWPIPEITISERIEPLPDGLSFIDNGDGTARIWGTPEKGTQGVYALAIAASNGVTRNDTQNFTLTVVQSFWDNFLPLFTN
jgi:hypothetical protein